MKRALSPSTNPAGLMSAAAAIYAAVVMIVHVVHHQGVIDPQVIVSAIAAAAALYTRLKVTPVADPRDGNGKPLAAASPAQPAAEVQYPFRTSAPTSRVGEPPHDPMQRPGA